jgi:hypothetical protein
MVGHHTGDVLAFHLTSCCLFFSFQAAPAKSVVAASAAVTLKRPLAPHAEIEDDLADSADSADSAAVSFLTHTFFVFLHGVLYLFCSVIVRQYVSVTPVI